MWVGMPDRFVLVGVAVPGSGGDAFVSVVVMTVGMAVFMLVHLDDMNVGVTVLLAE